MGAQNLTYFGDLVLHYTVQLPLPHFYSSPVSFSLLDILPNSQQQNCSVTELN